MKNILFSILIVFLCICILETATRITYAINRKDFAYLFYGKIFMQGEAIKAINKVKDLFYAKEAINSDKTMWVFGGSTTKCTPYVREKYAWTTHLESYLAIDVVNKGMRGVTSNGYLDNLKKSLLKEDPPDIVIFYIGINDTVDISIYSGKIRTNKQLTIPWWEKIDSYLYDVSLLYSRIKRVCIRYVTKKAARDYEVISDLDYFRKNLEEIVKISKQFGFELIFATIPVSKRFFEFHPHMYPIFMEVNQIIAEVSYENGIKFCDVYNNISLTIKDYYKDDLHLNEEGNRKLADFFYKYLKEINLKEI